MATKIKVIGKTQNGAALGIAKAYVEMNPNTTLADLRKAFPNDIAPDKGVAEMFLPLADAEAFNANMSLYFTKDERPIHLQDGSTVAMAQMWTSKSLQNLIKVAAKYHIEVEVNKDANVDFGKLGYALNNAEDTIADSVSDCLISKKMSGKVGFFAELYFERGDGYIISIPDEDHHVSIEYRYSNECIKDALCEAAKIANFVYDLTWDNLTFARNFCTKYGQYDSLCEIGQYEIEVDDEDEEIEDEYRVIVTRTCENAKGTMREISERIGFEYDPNWTTQQFGAKLSKELYKYENNDDWE